jgi:hypothetical protein
VSTRDRHRRRMCKTLQLSAPHLLLMAGKQVGPDQDISQGLQIHLPEEFVRLKPVSGLTHLLDALILPPASMKFLLLFHERRKCDFGEAASHSNSGYG